jgi:ADP-ribose pyrophosphatase YjhB (NUDIX family)
MHQGYWGLFGGRCEPRESPRHTVVREIDEELQIKLRASALHTLGDVAIQRGERYSGLALRYFSCKLDREMDTLTLRRTPESNKVEGDGLAWFTAEEANHLLVRPEDRVAIALFFDRNGL